MSSAAYGVAYREAHAGHLSRGQRRVMGAIETPVFSRPSGGDQPEERDCERPYPAHCGPRPVLPRQTRQCATHSSGS
jgi:hypothetical protein